MKSLSNFRNLMPVPHAPDPYAVMAFGRYSTRSRVVKENVCPTWDQTMMIKQIRLFGDPMNILESPPQVYIDFYDKDTVVSWSQTFFCYPFL